MPVGPQCYVYESFRRKTGRRKSTAFIRIILFFDTAFKYDFFPLLFAKTCLFMGTYLKILRYIEIPVISHKFFKNLERRKPFQCKKLYFCTFNSLQLSC